MFSQTVAVGEDTKTGEIPEVTGRTVFMCVGIRILILL